MKKTIIKLLTTISALVFCSCGGGNIFKEPQNPDVKLSEDHGKMLNLIYSLDDYMFERWRIDLDTSGDNYYIEYN